MCTVSMIGDSFRDLYEPKIPEWFPGIVPTQPGLPRSPFVVPDGMEPKITRKEFDDLKKEIELMKDLLKRAVQYDKDNNEPYCETAEKMMLLRLIAKAVGVNIEDVLK